MYFSSNLYIHYKNGKKNTYLSPSYRQTETTVGVEDYAPSLKLAEHSSLKKGRNA